MRVYRGRNFWMCAHHNIAAVCSMVFSYLGAPTVHTAKQLMCWSQSGERLKIRHMPPYKPARWHSLKPNNLYIHIQLFFSTVILLHTHAWHVHGFCLSRSSFSEVKVIWPSPGLLFSTGHTIAVSLTPNPTILKRNLGIFLAVGYSIDGNLNTYGTLHQLY